MFGGGGVSLDQLCLLWRLSAAVGSFAHTHSPFPTCSHCSPDIASYAETPSTRFIPPPHPEASGRSQKAVLLIMRAFQLDAKTGKELNFESILQTCNVFLLSRSKSRVLILLGWFYLGKRP